MIVVADSSPLRYLVLLNSTYLLEQLFGRVIVPDVVAHELSAAGAPHAVRMWMAQPPGWLEVVSVSSDAVATVTDELDDGERAAIALATTLPSDLLLIDDAQGREEARRRRIRVTGTLGVLRAAAEKDLVDVPAVLAQLKETNFYVEDELVQAIFGRWLRT